MNKPLQYFFVYCLLSTAYYLLSYAYPPGWSDDILLTPEDNKVRIYPDVDVDGFNNVWAVWDSATWVNGTGEILYSKRDSLGGCLIPETNVSNNTSFSTVSRIAVDASNNVQFIWRDETPLGIGVWHAKLANDGATIVSPHLAVNGNNDGFPYAIALNKYNEINICWDEIASGTNRTNYTKLDSLGNPIIPKIQVSPSGIYSCWCGIGVDSFANNHLGYRTNKTSTDSLAYTKLDKDGNVLIDYKILGTGGLPTIISDISQNIHIIYADPEGLGISIKYLKLDQNGNVLIGPKILSIHENNNYPHMAMDSLQFLHVVWEAESLGAFPIMYTKLDTLGNFIIPPMQVVYPPYTPGGGLARIAIDHSNKIHLVWVDGRLNPGVTTDIFYKRGENESTVKELARLKAQNQPKIFVVPNPFVNETKITFSVGSIGQSVTRYGGLKIYDVTGRLIRQWDYTTIGLSDQVVWHGDDNYGLEVRSGVYFIWFEAEEFLVIEKVIKLTREESRR